MYASQSGSKLYSTDNTNSDTDYKGLFHEWRSSEEGHKPLET